MTSILRLARRLRSDEGVALPVVFGLGLAMLALVAGAMTVATRGIVRTNTDEDFNGALAAAYAGIEEYQSRLSQDSNYQKFGNGLAPYSASSASSLSLPTGANTNPAFDIGTTGAWANIPGVPLADGTATLSGASYRYEVNNKDYQDKGILHIRSTGRVGSVTRSVVADLKQSGFIDYLWFTNYEVSDPAYSANSASALTQCEKYAYTTPAQTTIRDDGVCGTIQFGTADILRGPVRSNDRLLICQTDFKKSVISASTTNPIFKTPSGCTQPNFEGGNPKKGDPIDMPPTNTAMKLETYNDRSSDVPRPGCMYTGPTVITYLTVGGVAKMRVLSPWTRFTNLATNPSAATNPPQCGVPGSADGQLGGKNGALLDVLDRNLIYVEGVPAVGSGEANAPKDANPPANFTCTNAGTVKVSGNNVAYPAGWMFKDGSTVVAKFPASDGTPTGTETTPYTGSQVASTYKHYGCQAGDVYVSGQVDGQMTIAADNFIYVTGDLTYKDKATDVLGLVATSAVFVWNPVRVTGFSGSDPIYAGILGTGNREIDAALLSVGHTFQVQNYNRGARGVLTIFGAIAQKFRGSVGDVGGNGYKKDYQYDDRFKNIAPPKFLTPTSTTYGVTQVATVPAAFTSTGAPG